VGLRVSARKPFDGGSGVRGVGAIRYLDLPKEIRNNLSMLKATENSKLLGFTGSDFER
jgi:hypothetical protein